MAPNRGMKGTSKETTPGTAWAQESFGRLVYRLERHRRMHFDDALKPYGLTSPHGPLLALLWEGEGRDTQATMAEELSIDPATVTRGLRKLEELGYAHKEVSDRDSRAFRIVLTKTGREAAKAAWDAAREWNDAIGAGAGGDSEERARELMRSMLESLQARLGHRD